MFGGLPATLLSMLFVQGVLAAVLFTLVGVAYYRRRSRPYLLVLIAASTLLIESVIGAAGLLVSSDPWLHIFVDYALDITLVGAILGAIYYARHLESPTTNSHDSA